jgi:hypothetical protein
MRLAARVDSTQADIVDAFRAMGASVWIIGLPVDLIVGWRSSSILVEVKRLTGKRDPKPTKYTPLQRDFMATWKGGPVATVCDVDGAIRLLKSVEGA